MKLRGALYGCGMISEFHLRGWLRIPEVEMVALGNRTLSRAIERRDAFVPGARVYSGLAEMLDAEQIEGVISMISDCGTESGRTYLGA